MAPRRPQLLESSQLWEYALKALAARDHSSGQLREKLRRRAARKEDVEGILSRLKQSGYLNDRRYAETYAAARLSSQGFGKIRVVRDLQAHRVARQVAERAAAAAYRETDEERLIEDFLARKFRRVNLDEFLADPRNLAGACRKLIRAGFRWSVALRVLKRHAREPELLDSMEPPEMETGPAEN